MTMMYARKIKCLQVSAGVAMLGALVATTASYVWGSHWFSFAASVLLVTWFFIYKKARDTAFRQLADEYVKLAAQYEILCSHSAEERELVRSLVRSVRDSIQEPDVRPGRRGQSPL